MLPDGSRLHVVISDITRRHWSVNIRKFVVRATHLEDLVQLGSMTTQCASLLEASVASGLNILVAGGTQAGKPLFASTPSGAATPARTNRHYRALGCTPMLMAGSTAMAERWQQSGIG